MVALGAVRKACRSLHTSSASSVARPRCPMSLIPRPYAAGFERQSLPECNQTSSTLMKKNSYHFVESAVHQTVGTGAGVAFPMQVEVRSMYSKTSSRLLLVLKHA